MKKRQYKTMKRRVCALLLAVFMTIGLCVPAMASEITAEDILTDTAVTTTEDAAIGETTAPADIAPVSETSAEGSEFTEKADTTASGEITEPAADTAVISDEISQEENAGTGFLESDDDSKLSADMAINRLMSGEEIPAESSEPVSGSDYVITRYTSRIVIENKAAQKDLAHNLYAVIVYTDPARQARELFIGTKITPGASVSLYRMSDEKGNDIGLDTVSDYTVLLGRAYEWEDDDTGEKHIEDFGLLGWFPEYDEKGEPKEDPQGKVIYEEYNILKKVNVPASTAKEEPAQEWKDGSTINMKAGIQKNMQIKISWSPNNKDDKQKTYKKYALYELKMDSASETGYSETLRWPVDKKGAPAAHSGSKSATLDPGIDKTSLLLNSSLIYMLRCYDKDDKEVDKYVTTVAPFLFQIQSGFDLTFTQSADNNAMSYILELAEKNRESDGVKINDGFKPEWRVEYGCEYLEDIYSIGEYPVNAKITTKAVQLNYPNGSPLIATGKPGFARVRTVAFINGVKVVSAPSNVLSCKAGPDKCYVMDLAGIIYDPLDAKKNNNKENTLRADAHVREFFGGTGESESSMARDEIYIHGGDTGTCAKSGMVFFFGLPDESNIKSYDLLRSDKLNGTYKKIKSYQLGKDLMLIRCSEKLDDRPIYAMQFNSFQPEKEFYYAVQAVSKTGSAPGSRGIGKPNTCMPDKVQDFGTVDVSTLMIGLTWRRDDCVKQYWIYRNTESAGDIATTGCKGTPIAKIGPGSKMYTAYEDKKVVTEQKYYYYIRPVYDTKKAASDPMYNAGLCSNELIGRATAKFTPVKTFKSSNYSTAQILLKFNQVKGLSKYRIWRLKVTEADKKLTADMQPDVFSKMLPGETIEQFEDRVEKWGLEEWKTFFAEFSGGKYVWHYVDEVEGDRISTKEKSLYDKVDVGGCYYYLIQGAGDESTGLVFTPTAFIQNKPLGVTDLKADWSGYENGIKVSWGRNKKDDAYSGDLTVLLSRDNKNWSVMNKKEFTDYSTPRGQLRYYVVAVVYHYKQADEVWSNKASIPCCLPNRIELEKSKYTIRVGESVDIKASAVTDSGQTPTVSGIKYEKHGDCIEGSGNHYTGKFEQTGYVTLSVAGLSKDVEIKVIK